VRVHSGSSSVCVCVWTVLSDMAHSFVGVGSLDHDKQIELAQQAFTFSLLVGRLPVW